MVDVDAMARALGGDGSIRFETETQKGAVHVVDGRVYSTVALKRAISVEAVEEALLDNGAGRLPSVGGTG